MVFGCLQFLSWPSSALKFQFYGIMEMFIIIIIIFINHDHYNHHCQYYSLIINISFSGVISLVGHYEGIHLVYRIITAAVSVSFVGEIWTSYSHCNILFDLSVLYTKKLSPIKTPISAVLRSFVSQNVA